MVSPGRAFAGSRWAKAFYFLSVAFGVGLLVGIVLLTFFMQRASLEKHPWLARGFVGDRVAGTARQFHSSMFLPVRLTPACQGRSLRGRSLHRLRSRSRHRSLKDICAREFLYPNWSSAFGLADVRSLDAIHYYRYRQFVRNFLLQRNGRHIHGDLYDRFTGSEFPYEFETETEKRFLALSSVKYLIAESEFGWPSKWLTEIVEQHRGEPLIGFGSDVFRSAAR